MNLDDILRDALKVLDAERPLRSRESYERLQMMVHRAVLEKFKEIKAEKNKGK